MLGLPDSITGLLFDLDGVLTQTAKVHFRAWKQTFDGFLRERDGDGFAPFTQEDYNEHVDGMPRSDGVRSFLASRGIELREEAEDAAAEDDGPTVHSLGDAKNDLVQQLIARDGVETYDGSVAYVKAARAAHLRCAVVSASANCQPVLRAAGIVDLFDAIIDGGVAEARDLRGKPHPDTYLAGAAAIDTPAGASAVFEDATAGVQAGRDGHFGYVVGVDRVGHAAALRDHGADVVVTDLAQLLAP